MKRGKIIIYAFCALLMSFLFIDDGKAITYGKISKDISDLRKNTNNIKLLRETRGVLVGDDLKYEYGSFSLARPINGMSHSVSEKNNKLLVGSEKTGATLKRVCYDWAKNVYNSFTTVSGDDYNESADYFDMRPGNDNYKCVKKTPEKTIQFHDTAEIARIVTKDKTIKSGMVVKYTNAGVYNNQKIDVKATIKNLAVGTELDDKMPIVHLYPANMGVSVAGVRWVAITYEFLKHGENTPVSVKGNTSYWDIDGYQGIIMADSSNKGIYVDSSCELKVGNIQGYKYVFADGIKNSGEKNDKFAAFTEAFEGESVTRIYQFADSGDSFSQLMPKGGIMHSRNTVPTIECPSGDCDKTEPTYTYACEEVKETYGQCKIREDKDGKFNRYITTDAINCNDSNKRKGKTTYTTDDGDVIRFSACPYKPKYNYDVDIACEDCEGTSENGSYHIQDTTDWEAIIHSLKRNDNTTLQTYFKETNNVLCRDEFNIVLPNANTTKGIYTMQGSYITVNMANPIDYIDNFAPIKVTRTRQCISKNGRYNNTSPFSDKSFGNINLKYNEKAYSYEFAGNDTLIKERESEIEVIDDEITINSRYRSEVPNETYKIRTQKKSAYFVLPSDAYRWVVVGGKDGVNGTSLVHKDNKFTLRDLGTANLPISFANKDGATIRLNFVLPNDTGLSKAVENDKLNYLETKSTEKDIYNQGVASAQDNPFKDSRSNSSTACAKMYGFNSDEYRTCVNNKSNHKDCLKQLKSNNYDYSCKINSCNSEEDAKRLGVSWDEKLQKCVPPTPPGDDPSDECKTEQDAARLGRSWNIKDKTCCPVGEKYYASTEKCEPNVPNCTVAEDNRIYNAEPYKCDYDNVNRGTCYYDRCPVTRLCKMPDGSCTVPSGNPNNIIYRTIDLNNPFPGQSGKDNGRDTGTNWCTEDKNDVFRCSGKPSLNNQTSNQLAYNEIINNRGVPGYDIYKHSYDEDYALYKIELDADAIRKIKEINKNDDYDDWTYIKPDEVNGVYYSTFLNETFGRQKVQGKCMKNNSAKKTCTEG